MAKRDENDASKILEPYEEVVINAPLDFSVSVIDELSRRPGTIIELSESDTEVHIVAHIPARLLFGFKQDFVNITRGYGTFSRAFLMYDEIADKILDIDDHKGFLVSSETGKQ